MERDILMKAITGCYDALRVQRGWGIAEVAKELGVHYETARRLRAGEIKEPSFALVASLHLLANRSLDQWIGISAPTLGPEGAMAEKRLRELIVDQLGILLARGLTGQVSGRDADGMEETNLLQIQPGLIDGSWALQQPGGQMEDALLHAGKTLMQAGDSLLKAGGALKEGQADLQGSGRAKRRANPNGH